MSRRLGLAGLLLMLSAGPLLAAPCVNVVDSRGSGGIGGTGLREGRGGLGGTGLIGEPGTGGIGGTGRRPGEALIMVGTITGFASICVNGLEVHYAPATPVDRNGEADSLASLAIGQVVTLQAVPGQQGLTTARISVQDALTGPITALSVSTGHVAVMGQPVLLPPALRPGLASARLGDMLRVSGHRRQDGAVLASHIQPVAADTPASVVGATGGAVAGSTLTVGGLAVTASGSREPLGQVMLARGRWNGRALVASEVRRSDSERLLQQGERVMIESVVNGVDADGNLRIESRTLLRQSTGTSQARLGDRVIVTGRVDERGRILTERLEIHGNALADVNALTREAAKTAKGAEKAATKVTLDAAKAAEDASERADKAAEKAAEKIADQQERAQRDQTRAVERAEKDRLDRQSRPEKVEKAEKVERADKVEKVERPDKVDKVERPEKVEKVERVEKLERPERVERAGKD